jgi:outer membrane protein assembly factor BamB
MTSSPEPLRTLNCPTCGAPLEVDVTQPTINCKYCNAVIENPQYHPVVPPPPTPVFRIETSTPTFPATINLPQIEQSQPKKGNAGCIVSLVVLIVIAIAGVGIYLLATGGTPAVNIIPMHIYAPSALVTSDAGPSIVAASYNPVSEKYGISRVDVKTKKILWTTMEQEGSMSTDEIVAGDTQVYVVIENRLVALQLADGKQAWEASLSDRTSGACDGGCVLVQKGKVLVLTTDNTLGAYDAVTGHQEWEKQFDLTNNRLTAIPQGIALYYRADKDVLAVLDPATGEETSHLEPTCESTHGMEDTLENNSRFVFDTTGKSNKVYTFFGLFNACIQRWDLSTGKVDWQWMEEDSNLQDPYDTPALMADGKIVFTQDNALRTVDTETGQEFQTLDTQENYRLVPYAVSGNRLIVRAVRTRGTTSYELWGYDLASGKNIWKRPLPKSSPLDPPDAFGSLIDSDESAWAFRQAPDGFWLLTFQSVPNQVTISQVNTDTGELSGQKMLPLNMGSDTDFYAAPDRIASQDNLSWFTVEQELYVIDPKGRGLRLSLAVSDHPTPDTFRLGQRFALPFFTIISIQARHDSHLRVGWVPGTTMVESIA